VQVSAAPMAAADLVYDAAGNVAWDEIWGDFCDLALAGGPSHRGTLLEPVDPQEVAADPIGYQRVLAELERGIHLITGLPVIAHQYPGWIGLQCTDEAMALWLLRAIVVENVSVRREDQVLYFPVGPNFRLAYEIKNIITVIAKTHHYWTEHLQSQLTPS
jgi:sirohydrochlorin cobaltochelatase